MDTKKLGLIGVGFLAGSLFSSLVYKYLSKKSLQKPLVESPHNKNVNNQPDNHKQRKSCQQLLSDPDYLHIKQEQLARIVKFFGEQNFSKLENSFVIVFGVGGVGSHVVNMLARSGVKKIRVIDFDTVSMSSLNRHSFALREDVGTLKVECLKKYVSKIFPHIQIQCINTYATVQNVRSLLLNPISHLPPIVPSSSPPALLKPDYIVDCIDNLDAKVELISACLQHNLKLIVSGGAGMKNDPTKIQIRDIKDCKYDKLIMRIKRQLTKKNIKSGVKVVFSYQQAEKELLPLTQVQQQNPHAYKVFDNYRIRIVPVLGTMPAIIGMTIASYVLCDLASQPYQPFQTDYIKSSAISKIFNQLQYQLRHRGCNMQTFLQVDVEQVSILAKKIYNWQCLVNPEKKGERLALWDRNKPASIQNLALLSKEHYEKHIKLMKIQDGNYSQQVLKRFEQKAKYAKKVMQSGYMMFI